MRVLLTLLLHADLRLSVRYFERAVRGPSGPSIEALPKSLMNLI